MLPDHYFSTTSSPLGTLRSSEEILFTMEERQRRLLEAEESAGAPPGWQRREKRESNVKIRTVVKVNIKEVNFPL